MPNDTTGNEMAQLPRLAPVEEPLNREGLLNAVAKAASAAAMGRDDRAAQRELDGDRFAVRIRFGCAASQSTAEGGAFSVRRDQENQRLRVRATPDLTEAEPWVAALGGEAVEAVEGFWMNRPWLLAPGCPVGPIPPSTPAQNAEDGARPAARDGQRWRVGIAQFFRVTESRTTRRDQRAYEATKLLAAGQTDPAQGYDLILSGRLRELPDGRVISCHVVSHALPPECVVSASFDQVRIERADTQDVLAEWSS